MITQKPVKFGDLKVGDLFRYNEDAEGIDKKVEPVARSDNKICLCGCGTAWANTAIGVDMTVRLHICDDQTVWVDVDESDDITLVLVTDPPMETATTAPDPERSA